jgi:hypothetical protein
MLIFVIGVCFTNSTLSAFGRTGIETTASVPSKAGEGEFTTKSKKSKKLKKFKEKLFRLFRLGG